MRYTLDSNIIINILRGDKELSSKISKLGGEIIIIPIVACELFRGVWLSTKKEEGLKTLKEFFKGFKIA